jgi:hypothetical protein
MPQGRINLTHFPGQAHLIHTPQLVQYVSGSGLEKPHFLISANYVSVYDTQFIGTIPLNAGLCWNLRRIPSRETRHSRMALVYMQVGSTHAGGVGPSQLIDNTIYLAEYCSFFGLRAYISHLQKIFF